MRGLRSCAQLAASSDPSANADEFVLAPRAVELDIWNLADWNPTISHTIGYVDMRI